MAQLGHARFGCPCKTLYTLSPVTANETATAYLGVTYGGFRHDKRVTLKVAMTVQRFHVILDRLGVTTSFIAVTLRAPHIIGVTSSLSR